MRTDRLQGIIFNQTENVPVLNEALKRIGSTFKHSKHFISRYEAKKSDNKLKDELSKRLGLIV